MTALRRFWPALECVADTKTTATRWRMLLGAEYACTQHLLRPQDELALSYQDPNPHRSSYHVAIHGADGFVGVCETTGEEIPLTAADLMLYELDRPALCRAASTALDLTAGRAPAEPFTGATYLGDYYPFPGRCIPTYLSICWRTPDFLQVVYDLAAQGNPFLLAAPTRRFFTPVVQSIVQQNNAALMPLDDVLTLDATGDFRVMPEGRALLMKYAEQPIDGNGVAADPQINEFRRFGSMWQIRFAGKMVFVADRQGLHYIAHLLSRPDQPIPCVQVLAATRQRNVAVGSCGTNLDAEAVATYKRRIVELEEELAEATRNHDYGRQETYQVELDCLMTEVKAAVGLGGRRRERSDAYRISKAMSMAMMRAVRAIATEHPALAEHLKDTITAGRFLCYAPKRPVTWVV